MSTLVLHRRNLTLKCCNFRLRYGPGVRGQWRIPPRNRLLQILYFLTHGCDFLVNISRHGAFLLVRILAHIEMLCSSKTSKRKLGSFPSSDRRELALALRTRRCETGAMTIDWLAELKCNAALAAHC